MEENGKKGAAQLKGTRRGIGECGKNTFKSSWREKDIRIPFGVTNNRGIETKNLKGVPTKEEMIKIVNLQIKKLPFLYYGTKKELDKQKIKPVVI